MLLILEVILVVLLVALPVVRFLCRVVAVIITLFRIQDSARHSGPHVTSPSKSSPPVPASARHTTSVLSINPVKLSQSSSLPTSSLPSSEDEATEAILQDFLKKRGIANDFNYLPESWQY
jgi:hypothetical protein